MLNWLSSNLSTILISLVLLAIVISIIRYLINQKKQGKHTCGGSCGGACAGCSACGGKCHNGQRISELQAHGNDPVRLFYSPACLNIRRWSGRCAFPAFCGLISTSRPFSLRKQYGFPPVFSVFLSAMPIGFFAYSCL